MIQNPLVQCVAQIQSLPFPEAIKEGLLIFYKSYEQILLTLEEKSIRNTLEKALLCYPKLILNEISTPFLFSHYHKKEISPFNFFQFGLDMVKPLVDETNIALLGIEHIAEIDYAAKKGENTVLFANHQAEIDPQIISLLIEPYSKYISEELICVAGHRVTQDPLAIPFSRGRNLICIYSKKYIDIPPEKRGEKLHHNTRALAEIEGLLHQGGAVIYIAPSGGRDRFSSDGVSVVPSHFDPQSIEMFRLLSKKAGKTTHFRLLALHTIEQLPPPQGENIQLGEKRIAKRAPTGLFFGETLDLEGIDSQIAEKSLFSENGSIKQRIRIERALLLDKEIQSMYKKLRQTLLR